MSIFDGSLFTAIKMVSPLAHTYEPYRSTDIYKSKAEMLKFLTLAIIIEATGFDIEQTQRETL